MKRNPFRIRPLEDFLKWVDDTDRGGKYLIIVAVIFVAVMLWLTAPLLKED